MSERRSAFVLGDHTFVDSNENAPLSRLSAPKRQILGAPPPTFLTGIARAASPASPTAKALYSGEFCGHGEPTMTIFEIVIDGAEMLEVGAVTDANDPDGRRNLPLLLARKPGGEWRVLCRREWEDARSTLVNVGPTSLSLAERAAVVSYGMGRVAIGFEYPADATAVDEVSWVAIDVLLAGEEAPGCVVNAELA